LKLYKNENDNNENQILPLIFLIKYQILVGKRIIYILRNILFANSTLGQNFREQKNGWRVFHFMKNGYIL